MPVTTQYITALVAISTILIVLSIGLLTTARDIRYLWARPQQLVWSVLAVDVLVPIVAVAIVRLFYLAPNAVIGLVLLSIAPVAPFAPQRALQRGGRIQFMISISATLTVLSMVTVPLTLAIMARFFAVKLGIPVGQIAAFVALLFLLPAGVGMGIRAVWPRVARALSRLAGLLGWVLISIAFVLIVIQTFPALGSLGARTFAATTLLVLAALFIGHVIGGPNPEDRTALALLCVTRHPGVGLLVAELNFPDQRVVPVVVAYILIAGALAIAYRTSRTVKERRLTKRRELWSSEVREAYRRHRSLGAPARQLSAGPSDVPPAT